MRETAANPAYFPLPQNNPLCAPTGKHKVIMFVPAELQNFAEIRLSQFKPRRHLEAMKEYDDE